jgi:hypothetical protein
MRNAHERAAVPARMSHSNGIRATTSRTSQGMTIGSIISGVSDRSSIRD